MFYLINFSKLAKAFLSFLLLFSLIGFHVVEAKAITPPEIRGQRSEAITQDMHGRDLKGYEFVKDDLRGVDFSEADLRGVVFNNTLLQSSSLKESDMENVVAFASIFDGSDLSGANLTNALLMQSSFKDSLIEGADFTNAVLDISQQKYLCEIANGVNSRTGISTEESLAC